MKTLSLSARGVQRFLNGFLCVYKPRDISVASLQKIICDSICDEANQLDAVEVPDISVPIVEPHPRTGALLVVGYRRQLDYVQHPLMSGQVFRAADIRVEPLQALGKCSSGVCLFGINEACEQFDAIRERSWLNEYQLDGTLGLEKHHHNIRGKIVAKAKYDHITQHRLQKLLTRLKFHYKRLAYELAGVPRGSQEAFELARRGAPRARLHGTPVVYDIRIRKFNSPDFSLGLQMTGETCYFLGAFVHELGCSVESVACPRRIRRIRQGPFNLYHALLDKQLSLVPILKNIQMCNRIVRDAMARDSDVIEMSEIYNKDESTILLRDFGLADELASLPEPEDCFRIAWGRNYE